MPATAEDLIRNLQELSRLAISSQSNVQADKVLQMIFNLSIKNTRFEEQEKIALGSLLAQAIIPFEKSIETTALKYRTRLESSVLRKRSALQYLMDDYGQFPVEGPSTLLEQLKQANIDKSIAILDGTIRDWKDETDSDEGGTDRESAGGSLVPQSHIWWCE